MLKLHEAKRCSNKTQNDLESASEDQNLETLQNVAYIENLDETHFLDADHEVRFTKKCCQFLFNLSQLNYLFIGNYY